MIVISDIHIGTWFKHDEQRFIRFCEDAIKFYNTLIINGDILDSDSVPMGLLKQCYPELIEFILTNPNIIRLVGNHDTEKFDKNYTDGTVYIEHGHQAVAFSKFQGAREHKMKQRANRIMELHGYKYVVHGHTHRLSIDEMQDGYYIQTGSCCKNIEGCIIAPYEHRLFSVGLR